MRLGEDLGQVKPAMSQNLWRDVKIGSFKIENGSIHVGLHRVAKHVQVQ
jgi:hypothetical protein